MSREKGKLTTADYLQIKERNTYNFFEMLVPMIAEYIVNRSKEYSKAPWSI